MEDQRGSSALTVMATMPWPAYSVALLPYFLRVGHSSYSADDFMTRNNGKAVPEESLLYDGVGVTNTHG